MVKEKSAFRYLNASVFLNFLGRQLYSIFVPVVMLQNGYSLNWVLLFLGLSSIITIISSYIGQRFMKQKNVLFFNLFSVAAQILLLILLTFSGFSKTVFIGIFLFEGFYYAFYYLWYWSVTTHYTSKETTGNNLGNLTITVALASIAGPLIGSAILDGSQTMLSGIAVTALLLSVIPVLKISTPEVENQKSRKIEWRSIKRELLNYSIMSSFEVTIFVLWGIYAYINDFALVEIGMIVAATALARITISALIKNKLSDEKFRKTIMTFSVLGVMLASIYRYQIPEHILVTNVLMSLFYVGFQLGTQTSIINSFKGSKTYYSSMILQTNTFMTRIIVYVIAFVIGLEMIILLPVFAGALYLISAKF